MSDDKYIVFMVRAGLIEDNFFKVHEEEDAKEVAKKIAESYWLADRYANPQHPHYTDKYKEETEEKYETIYEQIDDLCECVQLNEEDDIVIKIVVP